MSNTDMHDAQEVQPITVDEIIDFLTRSRTKNRHDLSLFLALQALKLLRSEIKTLEGRLNETSCNNSSCMLRRNDRVGS
jgi:hypothetical protein